MKNLNYGIVLLKLMMAFMVVAAHYSSVQGLFSIFCPCAVPVFMTISFYFFSKNTFNCCNANITAPPIIKYIILKVFNVIGSFGVSRVVGPMKTAYREPIIRPKIR